jgi:hydroxymethylbilane synthase
MKLIRIGTRGSALALAQAAWVKARLEKRYPDARIETVSIKTSGDRFFEASLQSIGGKGIFTKEIEEALVRDQIDIAVHSMKDLPTLLPAGLILAAVPEREDARDALVSGGGAALAQLSSGARLATGSLRRKAQITHCRPDLRVVPIRGNVDTRLKKLDGGECDALIMAAAGLKRIGREDRITEYLPNAVCLSAVAQGALGLESRENDNSIRDALAFLHDPVCCAEVSAERAFLNRLGGGCHIPVAARAVVERENLNLYGVIADPDGRSVYRGEVSGAVNQADDLGRELAERLLSQGADRILATA